jgi:hypothetical protein
MSYILVAVLAMMIGTALPQFELFLFTAVFSVWVGIPYLIFDVYGLVIPLCAVLWAWWSR